MLAKFIRFIECDRNGWAFLLMLSAAYIVSRLIYLDADIPIWSISHYAPIDEFYYTGASFDIVEGVHSPDGKLLSSQGIGFNILQQLITAGFIYIFGDNYYALRLPSVLSGLVVIVCFYRIVLHRFGFYHAIVFSLLLISELSFVLATRVAEPTIFRLAAASLLILYCVINVDKLTPRKCLSIGILTGLSWLFIYPSNAFLGLFSFLIVMFFTRKHLAKNISYYILGVAISLAIYICACYFLGYGFNELTSSLKVGAPRVSGVDATKNIFMIMLYSLIDVRSAKYFSTYPWFFIASAISVFYLLIDIFVKKKGINHIDYTILIFFIAFLLQTLFVNDYPQRKLVFLLPIWLYICMLAIRQVVSRFHWMETKTGGIAIASAAILCFLYPTIKTVYVTPQYTYKLAMEKLSKLGDVRLIGELSYGFRLYNNYRPYLNRYTIVHANPGEYYKIMSEAGLTGKADLTISYGDAGTEDKLKSIGFYRDALVLKSIDPMYPDVYLYRFKSGVVG